MNKPIYNIDFNKLASWLIPDRIKHPFNISWIQALISPIITLYLDFKRFKEQKEYHLMITPQVCYLERLLNDRYDYTERRIRIEDPVYNNPVVFYQEEELKYVDFYQEEEDQPVVFYTEEEAGSSKIHFIVLVPASISFEDSAMYALVKSYRLPGKKFKIQRI